MQLPLLPLPTGILTDWVPIDSEDYARPAHSGEYDLCDQFGKTYRTHYDARHDMWDGAPCIWSLQWAKAWRGCTVPFVECTNDN